MSISKNITIVGGKGQMGLLFASFLNSIGHCIQVLDKEHWHNAAELLSQADLVLVTVPIHKTEAIIRQLKPFLPQQAILADLTSLQAKPLNIMLEVHTGPVIGLHPMFGPTISSAANQGIIFSEGRMMDKCQWLLNDLQQLGFTLQSMPAEKHDQMMNFIQGLEHFITIALGQFLQDQQIDIPALNQLSSPIYRIKLLLLGRIFDQDPGLYADILMADESRVDLIAQFLEQAKGLHHDLVKNDREKVINQFNQTKAYLGKFTQLGQQESDNLLNHYYARTKL